MIQAQISNLDPVQVEYWNPPSFREKLMIADVENIDHVDSEDQFGNHCMMPLIIFNNNLYNKENKVPQLNQSCFIEESGEGKCRIVKL